MNPILTTALGNRSAAQVLMYLQAYGSGYISRIADTYGVSKDPIAKQLLRLEANGILVSREVGRTRVFEFNTRNPSVRNLREFLASELEMLPESELRAYYRQRQRPRRTGKQP